MQKMPKRHRLEGREISVIFRDFGTLERTESKAMKGLVCDYSGHSCKCQGFEPGQRRSLCVCGHHKNQHQSSVNTSHIERLNNFMRYGVERIETDESVPEGQFLTNSERTLIRVHPSREAWVKKVLADDWEKRRK